MYYTSERPASSCRPCENLNARASGMSCAACTANTQTNAPQSEIVALLGAVAFPGPFLPP